MQIDRKLAGRLADAMKGVADGETPAKAFDKAGVSQKDVEHFTRSLMEVLRTEGAGKSTPPRASGTRGKKPAGKSKRGALGTAVAYSDGGSRGNPGNAACAALVYDTDGNELLRRGKKLGRATNNTAEYEGAILALELSFDLGADRLELRLDSELVVRQLDGAYKVKNEGLKPLYARAMDLIAGFERVVLKHVPRAENKEADKLVGAILDGKALPDA